MYICTYIWMFIANMQNKHNLLAAGSLDGLFAGSLAATGFWTGNLIPGGLDGRGGTAAL